jgi:hypothetical protein
MLQKEEGELQNALIPDALEEHFLLSDGYVIYCGRIQVLSRYSVPFLCSQLPDNGPGIPEYDLSGKVGLTCETGEEVAAYDQ